MIRYLYIILISGIIHLTQAETVRFSDSVADSPNNWGGITSVATQDGFGRTYTIIQDGITFELDVRGYRDYTGTKTGQGIGIFANGKGIGVLGGTSNSADTRISNNTLGDPTDDEYIEFKLRVSGGQLASLSLLEFNSVYGLGDYITAVDDKGVSDAISKSSGVFDYTDFAGLSELTTGNIDSWSLAFGYADANNNENVVHSLDHITFQYTLIPESGYWGWCAILVALSIVFRRMHRKH